MNVVRAAASCSCCSAMSPRVMRSRPYALGLVLIVVLPQYCLQATLAPRLYDHCMKHHPEEGMTFNVFVETISIVCLGSINARLALIVGMHQDPVPPASGDPAVAATETETHCGVSHEEFARLW